MMMRLRRDGEEGVVLVTVLLLTMVMLIIVAGTMAYAVGSQPVSRRDQDWNAALAAAEAGLDDYLFRLNENDQYYLYSATVNPPDGNLAFKQWVSVPDSGSASVGCTASADSNIPCFRYSVDTSNLVSQGAIILTATGRSRTVTRTIQATLRRHAFIDYLYFTDYETKDPASYDTAVDDYTPAEAQTYCAKRYYEGRDIAGRVDFAGDTDGNACTEISFQTADTINGPLHSNDAIRICGNPTFNGNVTTSWNPSSGNKWVARAAGSSPTFSRPGDPKYADPLTMPPSNVSIKSDADGGARGNWLPLHGTDRDHAQLRRHDGRGESRHAVDQRQLRRARASRCRRTVSSTCRTCRRPRRIPTTRRPAVRRPSSARAGTTVQHPLGYPQTVRHHDLRLQERRCVPEGDPEGSSHDRGRQQHRHHRQRDVPGGHRRERPPGPRREQLRRDLPPGDETAAPSGNVRNGAQGERLLQPRRRCRRARRPPSTIPPCRPRSCPFSTPSGYRTTSTGRTILGAITINGAIAQKYRGIVGTIGTSGYGKNYNYDNRLKYQSPPHFLSPIAAAWQIVTWIEQKAACTWSYSASTGCP